MNLGLLQKATAINATGRIRVGLRKTALLTLALGVGILPMSDAASATQSNTAVSLDNPVSEEGMPTQVKPELANCGTVYGLRRNKPHNVEQVDPATGKSRVLFNMGDQVTWLNGLGLDRDTQTFWAVQQDGTGESKLLAAPEIFSYNTNTGTESKYTGAAIATPQPRAAMVAGAFNPNSKIYYYGQIAQGNFYVYGFDSVAKKPITGAIAVIPVGNAQNGDFAFDSTGRLFIAADGMLFVTQDPMPTTGSANPPKIPARGIAKLSDTPLGSGAFGSDGLLYLATGDGKVFTVDPSSGETTHTSQLQKSSNPLADFASCSPPRTLMLMKDLPSGRFTDTDQFKLSIDGGGLSNGNVGTTTGNVTGLQNTDFASYAGPVAVKPGGTYKLSELGVSGTQDAQYDSSWSCFLGKKIIAKGSGREGSVTIPLTPADGTDIACRFTNTPNGKVSFAKAASPVSGTPVQANDTITYTLTFTNTTSAAKAIDTYDDMSQVLGNATLVSDPISSTKSLTVTSGNGRITVKGSLAASSSATVTYAVRVKEKANRAGNSVKNLIAGCASSKTCTTEHPIRELGVTKAASPWAGGVDYSVTVTNTGRAPYTTDKPATMTDDLSELVNLGALYRGNVTASTGAASVADNRLKWSGALGVGESATITYSFDSSRVDGNAQLPNTACVPLAGQDPECKSTSTPVPPAPRIDPPCEGPDCDHLSPEFTKVLEGVDSEIAADAEADYVVKIHNPYSDSLEFDLVDYLSDVLDDATIVGTPTVSRDTVAVDRTDANAWAIHGSLQAGETVQVRYRIRVNNAGQSGNRILNNYIVPPEQSAPSSCTSQEQEKLHCTTHTVPVPKPIPPIGSLVAGKSSDPASGSPLQSGDIITYTLNFANTTENDLAIDTFDDLSKVLNNAEIVEGPSSSNDSLQAVLRKDRIVITGTTPAGSFTSITYSVRVLEKADRASNELVNDLAGCTAGQECSTQHPIRDLSVVKRAASSPGVVSYAVTVTNTGKVAYVTDAPATMADDLTMLSQYGAVYRGDVAASAGEASVSGNTLSWSGVLDAGESATVTYSFDTSKVPTEVRLPNTACVPVAGEDQECESLLTAVPPLPQTPPECEEPGECVPEPPSPPSGPKDPEFSKVMEGVDKTLQPGQEADYLVKIHNPHAEKISFAITDYLSEVLDDAAIVDGPSTSISSMVVDQKNPTVWEFKGTLDAKQTVEIRYRIRVNSAAKSGDRVLNNYVVIGGENQPKSCASAAQQSLHCTHHTVPPTGNPPVSPPAKSVRPLAKTGSGGSAMLLGVGTVIAAGGAGLILIRSAGRKKARSY